MCRLVIIILLVFNLLLYFVPPPVWGQEHPESGTDPKKQENLAALGEKINNPLSDLWLLSIQSDFQWWNGEITDKTRLVNITLLQPVMPFALSENWRMIVRPIFPFASFPFSGFDYETGPEGPIPVPNFARQNGLGDIVLWTAFSNRYTPPNVFGFGPTLMLPTGTHRTLTTGKFSMGPMVAAFHMGKKWIVGTVVQQWWSVAGDPHRSQVNLTDIQYVVRFRLTPTTNIGCAPNIRINWAADSQDRLTFPIGFGGDTLIRLGPLPVRVGAEFQYYPVTPEVAGPQYNLRLTLTPIIPAPAWAKRPLLSF